MKERVLCCGSTPSASSIARRGRRELALNGEAQVVASSQLDDLTTFSACTECQKLLQHAHDTNCYITLSIPYSARSSECRRSDEDGCAGARDEN